MWSGLFMLLVLSIIMAVAAREVGHAHAARSILPRGLTGLPELPTLALAHHEYSTSSNVYTRDTDLTGPDDGRPEDTQSPPATEPEHKEEDHDHEDWEPHAWVGASLVMGFVLIAGSLQSPKVYESSF
ncbi:unnamed protein product [Aureobasidium pullulans]|nr:unnamed protein product [Aureobasidium pullulans]